MHTLCCCHQKTQISCLVFYIRELGLLFILDETTRECLEIEGSERAAERTSVAKQTES